MDRQFTYPGAIPLETDLLNTNKNTMIALAKISAAVLGTSTQVNGLSVVPTGPASLQVFVNPGEIYSLQNVDNTAFSSIAADTTHQIVKQGISLNQVTLNCPAPATVGNSINYLIEAAYADADSLPVVLPYYNSANPATAFSGAANSGVPNNTARQGTIVLTAKAGVSAATGSQTTPAADAGNVALYVVTVANGQTQIVAGNIVAVVGAPFLNSGMLGQVATLLNTPAQFDNTAKVATTAFVQRALNGFNSGIQISATTVLTNAAVGAIIQWIGGASGTITLPLISSVPSGSAIAFVNNVATTLTLAGQGPDAFDGNGAITTVQLKQFDQLMIAAVGGSWFFVGGSASLPYVVNPQIGNTPASNDSTNKIATTAFANPGSSLATNGYQKMPSGLILQWGQVTSVGTSAGNAAATFAIAFPTSCLVAMATIIGSSAGNYTALTSSTSSTGATFSCESSGAYVTGQGIYYFAIGK